MGEQHQLMSYFSHFVHGRPVIISLSSSFALWLLSARRHARFDGDKGRDRTSTGGESGRYHDGGVAHLFYQSLRPSSIRIAS